MMSACPPRARRPSGAEVQPERVAVRNGQHCGQARCPSRGRYPRSNSPTDRPRRAEVLVDGSENASREGSHPRGGVSVDSRPCVDRGRALSSAEENRTRSSGARHALACFFGLVVARFLSHLRKKHGVMHDATVPCLVGDGLTRCVCFRTCAELRPFSDCFFLFCYGGGLKRSYKPVCG